MIKLDVENAPRHLRSLTGFFEDSLPAAGAGGAVTLTLPVNNPSLAGRAFYLQALEASTGKLSVGLELVFCP